MIQIFNGIDGSYIINNNKLVKIIKIIISDDWYKSTGGWCKYYLKDGTILTSN